MSNLELSKFRQNSFVIMLRIKLKSKNRFAYDLGSFCNCDQKLAAPVSHTLYLAKLVQCPICSSYIDTNVIAVQHLSHGP